MTLGVILGAPALIFEVGSTCCFWHLIFQPLVTVVWPISQSSPEG